MTSWRPIVTGDLARRCVDTARELALEIDRAAIADPSLAEGNAGRALLHAYLHFHEPDGGHDERALAALDRAIDSFAGGKVAMALFMGMPGVAWVSEHLQDRLIDRGEEDVNADIDELLQSELDQASPRARFDLISGIVGHGIYALERLRSGNGESLLRGIVAFLEARADRSPGGLCWRSSAAEIDDPRFPEGAFDPHVAHGAAGVVALLAAIHRAGIERDRCERLVEGAVSWILAQRLPDTARSVLPFFAAPEGTGTTSRLAWCRGDPGTATALLSAARTLGRPAWEEAARVMARRSAARDSADGKIVDAGLCHGAAGMALLCARLYHATGEAVLGEAAQRYALATLDLRSPGSGFAGYRRAYGEEWLADSGFLFGAAGIALGLLAVATAVEPAWDLCLLTTLPTTA